MDRNLHNQRTTHDGLHDVIYAVIPNGFDSVNSVDNKCNLKRKIV